MCKELGEEGRMLFHLAAEIEPRRMDGSERCALDSQVPAWSLARRGLDRTTHVENRAARALPGRECRVRKRVDRPSIRIAAALLERSRGEAPSTLRVPRPRARVHAHDCVRMQLQDLALDVRAFPPDGPLVATLQGQ